MKLFISYRSLDSAKVDALVARLRSLQKPDGSRLYEQIWQDKTHIPVGQDWWQAIVQGIKACDIFVFMISHESVQNVNCRAELSYARKRNRPIIPIVLEDEFRYNSVTGKNDIDYWSDIPAELNDGRFQFLFYEGVSFVSKLNTAVERLMTIDWRDIPADFPPDPRNASDETNDTALIYDRACDYAWRMEFTTAEKLFQRLMNWNDPLFGDEAHEWMLLLREYQRMARLHKRKNLHFKIPQLWDQYEDQFPKPFTKLFDPLDFQARYSDDAPPEETLVSERARPIVVSRPKPEIVTPSEPDYLAIARNFSGNSNDDWTPVFKTFTVNGIDFEMCLVPPGSFMMGSEDGDDDEKPVHKQTLQEPYWIGVHPVTNAQWRLAVERSGGSVPEPDKLEWYNDNAMRDHPVVRVSWNDCQKFLSWLGDAWRLPTEPEWEYAARGVDNLVYPFGNKFQPDLVVYRENSNGSPAAVGGRPGGASWVGAQDMSGNVWDWLRSEFREYPYKADDGRENISSNTRRVLRGGSWSLNRSFARAVYRHWYHPDLRNLNFGFRVCAPFSLVR